MSFILDALRKSETERQKKSAPGIVDGHYQRPEKTRSIWLPLLVVILGANAVVITALLLANSPEPTPADAGPKTRSPESVSAPVARPSEKPSTQKVAAARQEDVRPLYSEAADPEKSASPPAPELSPASRPTTGTPAKSAEAEVLPSLQQLAADGTVSLPELHVDIHVYSPESAQRFVFVNMNKYREGEVLKEGPRIEEITQTGAVLSHQGSRFTLERE